MAENSDLSVAHVVFDVEGSEGIASEVIAIEQDHVVEVVERSHGDDVQLVEVEIIDKVKTFHDDVEVDESPSGKILQDDNRTCGDGKVIISVVEPERFFNTVDIETTSDSSQTAEADVRSNRKTKKLRPVRTRKRQVPRAKTKPAKQGAPHKQRRKNTTSSPKGKEKLGMKERRSQQDQAKLGKIRIRANSEKNKSVKKERIRKANLYLRKGLDDPTSAPEVANIPEKERLKYGLEDLASGKYKTVAAAAAYWRVHAGKLYRRHRGDIPWDSRHGPAPVLTGEEEEDLARWILTMSKRGFQVSASLVRDAVQSFFKRDNSPFINGRPSYRWYYSFLRRNPKLRDIKASNLSLLCDACPSKAVIDGWFQELKSFLMKLGIADKPGQILNYAETGFEMSKATAKIVVFSQVSPGTPKQGCLKKRVSVGMCAGADGRLLPPFIIYRGAKPGQHWNPLDGAPFGSGTFFMEKDSEKPEVFSHWLEHHFLKNIGRQRPVALLLSSHQSDISYKTYVTACQNDVYLFRIPPRAASLLQPLDVSLEAGEGPFRSAWILKWMTENRSVLVDFSNIAHIIGCAWSTADNSEAIRTCYIQSGIHPLDRDMIDDDHLVDGNLDFLEEDDPQDEESPPARIPKHKQPSAATIPNVAEVAFLKIDKKLDKTTRETYRACIQSGLDLEETPLFSVWKRLYVEAYVHQGDDSETAPAYGKGRRSKKHSKSRSPGRRKSRKRKEDEVFCPVCDERYGDDGGEDWIGCDGECQSWYHVNCLPPEVVTPALLEEKEMVCPYCSNSRQI